MKKIIAILSFVLIFVSYSHAQGEVEAGRMSRNDLYGTAPVWQWAERLGHWEVILPVLPSIRRELPCIEVRKLWEQSIFLRKVQKWEM
jgi:hypothetical protein